MSWLKRFRQPGPRQFPWDDLSGAVLDQPFIRLSKDGLMLTHRDLMTSVFMTGSIGSGKSSVLLHFVASAMMWSYSLLLFTVKPSDVRDYLRIARCCGRQDVSVFRPETHAFNPIALMIQSMAGSPALAERIVALVMDAINKVHEGSSGDANFWNAQAERVIANLVTIALLAGVTPSFRWLLDAVRDRARSPAEAADPNWQHTNPVCRAIAAALERTTDPRSRRELDHSARWWLSEFPRVPERTASSIEITLQGPLDKLVRGVVGDVLNSDKPSWDPGWMLRRPGISIIDASTHEYGPIGTVLQRAIKRTFVEQIKSKNRVGGWPVLLVQDEVQELLDPTVDTELIRTLRSRRVSTIMATQTVSNIVEACREARAAADAALGLCGVRVTCAQCDPETLSWNERVLTSVATIKHSFGTSDRERERDSSGGSQSSKSSNYSTEYLPAVPASEILKLRTGGPPNDMIVEAIVSKVGTPFPTGRSHARVAFRQIDLR